MLLTKDKAMVGKPSYERREKEFYETPEWCTEVLLSKIDFKENGYNNVWEPAAGNGAIAKILEKHGLQVEATDIIQRDYPLFRVLDFLEWFPDTYHENIITNPPYKLAEHFVNVALDEVQKQKGKVAMLLRNEWDCAKSRTYLFTKKPFRCKIVLTKRPRWIEGTTTSPRHNYSWFVWDWSYQGKPYLEYQKDK